MKEPKKASHRVTFGPSRRWLMRLSAMLLIPLLIIGGLEILLRVSGFGYPTTFFIPSRVSGQEYLIPNYKFSHRFFPSHLARVPVLFRIPVEKRPGTVRIFIFGASAALGDPDPNYGFGSYLKVLLEARYPGTEFEIINTAMTAINSHVVLPIARECSKLDGDLWIIYLGNNETVGPFGAGTVFSSKSPSLTFVRISLILKSTRLGQLMMSVLSQGSDHTVPREWTGIDMFKENLVQHDDPARQRVYDNFRANLEDILAVAKKAEIPVVLSTVSSNLKDCSPFASLNRQDLEPEVQVEWDIAFKQGKDLESSGDIESALQAYANATQIDAEHAELQYRMGRCQISLGKEESALEHLLKARDFDALAVRADARINEMIKATGQGERAKVTLVDAESYLKGVSPSGIPGEFLFYEHVHFTPEGNYHLAECIANAVMQQLPKSVQISPADSWLDKTECDQRLALTVWDRLRLFKEMSDRLKESPFSQQSSNADNLDYLETRIANLNAGVTNSTFFQDQRLYEAALKIRPEDTLLAGNYAQFLDGNNKTAEAISLAEKIRDLLPDLAWTHYYLGALLAKNGNLKEAKVSLQRALELEDNFNQARELLKNVERERVNRLISPVSP